MELEKEVRRYTGLYRTALLRNGVAEADRKAQAYAAKLAEMYASEEYAKHDIYPTISTPLVYAVIAMCLQLKETGQTKEETIALVNDVFRTRKKLLGALEKVIDVFPIAWTATRKWNLSDHESRVKDGSITYDFFTAGENEISYRISKCGYVEMFEQYGIREYCKIFCMTDTQAYANLTRHVEFIRYEDLSDGGSCHDVVRRKR